MTTPRRRSRTARTHPVLLAAGLGLVVIIGLDVAHVLWLLVVGGLTAGAYIIVRDRRAAARTSLDIRRSPRPGPRTGAAQDPGRPGALGEQLAAVGAERDQLAARVADLERQLAEARDTAHAAWDAAASRAPAPVRDETQPIAAALLADPLSGVRRLRPRA